MEFRDIRKDLIDRLEAVDARHRAEMATFDQEQESLLRNHRDVVAAIEKERTALHQMLRFEEIRNGASRMTAPSIRALATLPEFIVTKVHTLGPIAKDDLRSEAAAAGYLDEANGRSFHLTLMNLRKHGKVMQLGDGRYVFPKAPDGLFEGADQPEEGEMRTIM